MRTIRELLDSLTADQHKLLMYSFENDLSQHVAIGIDEFVGVNVDVIHFPQLEITQRAGKWSAGTLKKPQK